MQSRDAFESGQPKNNMGRSDALSTTTFKYPLTLMASEPSEVRFLMKMLADGPTHTAADNRNGSDESALTEP